MATNWKIIIPTGTMPATKTMAYKAFTTFTPKAGGPKDKLQATIKFKITGSVTIT